MYITSVSCGLNALLVSAFTYVPLRLSAVNMTSANVQIFRLLIALFAVCATATSTELLGKKSTMIYATLILCELKRFLLALDKLFIGTIVNSHGTHGLRKLSKNYM